MECLSCHLSYTLTDRRPKKIHCEHLLCEECVKILSQSGELRCPQDNSASSVNEDTEFPEDKHTVEKMEAARLRCHSHQDLEASMFCPTHLLALCEQCFPQEGCKEQLDVYGDCDAVKFALWKVAEEFNTDRVPQTLKLRIRDKFRLPTEELLNLCKELKYIASPQQCIKCSSYSFEFVNLSDMCLYCTICYHESLNKDSESISHFIPFNEDCRQHIIKFVLGKLQKIDFCELSLSHYQFIDYQTGNLQEFFAGAKEIINLENNPRKSESSLPGYFLCPNCRTVFSKLDHRFRRLPCRDAFHAICETCAQASSTDVTCPLDQRVYHTSYTELPVFCISSCPSDTCEGEFGNGMEPPCTNTHPSRPIVSQIVRNPNKKIVGPGMTLSDKGIPIPPFQSSLEGFPCIPVLQLKAVDRFRSVLPPESPIPGLNVEEKAFSEPWYINNFPNQVEVLSFCSFDNAVLWGVGIANPIAPGAHAIVQWVRMYDGERAVGPNYTEMQLLNRDIVGGNGVITDIYFESPYPLRILQFVTLKVKISIPGSDERLAVYHGNHIGRYEDIVGTDDLSWEACPTFSVEENERNSGQQHFIGPLLRFIYQR